MTKIRVMEQKHIKRIREKIDSIDRKIVKLLIRRMALSRKISAQKKEITDNTREESVISNAEKEAGGKLGQNFLKNIFSLIIDESKKVQREKKDQTSE